MDIKAVLKNLAESKGSDLHIKAGRPPLYRISGDLVPGDAAPLSAEEVAAALQEVLGADGYKKLLEDYEYDTSYLVEGVGRFRVNAFRRLGEFGAVLRLIPLRVPTIDDMGLPQVLKKIADAPQGMVLVTGPTGSGKSTTLAAMINYVNESAACHIITIEDPIEFVYQDNVSTISQRQLGQDTKSFKEALRRALRQDPDVILMGEMRDRETIEFAMHAAETGHLVFSTLHTNDAKQTVDRIIDAFPGDMHAQVRTVLAMTLQAVISQRLVKRADGKGRIAAMEIMINTPTIKELLQEGKTRSIDKAIGQSARQGLQTFNQELARLVKEKLITEEEAYANTTAPNELQVMLRGFQSGGGTTTLESIQKQDEAPAEAAHAPPAHTPQRDAAGHAPATQATPAPAAPPAAKTPDTGTKPKDAPPPSPGGGKFKVGRF